MVPGSMAPFKTGETFDSRPFDTNDGHSSRAAEGAALVIAAHGCGCKDRIALKLTRHPSVWKKYPIPPSGKLHPWQA